jgi:crotonobetainyl-CoA:carnitine CoA-transferase CaiB-like acyl-CoA transferase
MVAARYFAGGGAPRRGADPLAGSLVCYRPYACADGHVTLGALEPKFFAAFCRGIGREDLVAGQFDPPGSGTHRELEAIFVSRTREQWAAFGAEHDCCLEPVLSLDEALDSELVRAREMVLTGADGSRQLAPPVKLSRTPGRPEAGLGPGLGEHTREVLGQSGFSDEEIDALIAGGAAAGPGDEIAGSFLA